MKKIIYLTIITFNSQSQRKGTMSFGDFQIIRPDLLGVVATGWERCDKGSPKAKILSWYYLMLLSNSVAEVSCMRM